MNNSYDLTLRSLFDQTYTALLYFSSKIIGDRDESEDIVQNALVTYWNRREEVGGSMHVVKSFLYTTVRNSCLDVLKHRSVIQKFRDQLETEPIDDRDIENEMIRAEVLSELFEAITHLPQGCRQILEMSFLDGRKNQEISDELGISINTVKTQKQRALQLLRLKLTSRTFSFFYMTFLS